MRHTHLVISMLLFLSGNVELNPGPNPSELSVTMTISCLNTRSATSIIHDLDKPALLLEFIHDRSIDVLFLTETWLSPKSPQSILNSLTPAGFSFSHSPRTSGRGGGLACISKSTISISHITKPTSQSFEYILFKFTSLVKLYFFLVVYGPPSNSKPQFIDDFSTLLEDLVLSQSDLVIMGDFNLQIDSPDDHYVASFLTLLDTFDLKQHISTPTHSSGHILDLLITRNSSTLPSHEIVEPFLSDHSAVILNLPVQINSSRSRVTKTVRKFSGINATNFSNDILASSLYTNPAPSLSEFSNQFNTVLSSVLDKHAPSKTITCRFQNTKPFITDDIKAEKSKRSHLETIYRNNKSSENKANFDIQAKKVQKMITKSKRSYYRQLISSCHDQPKNLWRTMNSLLGRNQPKILPNSDSSSALASSFITFFNDKISNLCATIPNYIDMTPHHYTSECQPSTFSHFDPCTEDEIRKLILSSSDATCSLDIIPTKLVKTCINAIAPPITRLINLSLSEGVFPDSFKHAVVTPLLKKPCLSKDELSNYRPISNLNFISKIFERVMQSRLKMHLDSFKLLSPYQSAYRKFHSTETALCRIHSDLNLAMNNEQVSALILLDLSAAFDTIDHNILISRLSQYFGISGSALSLITSYLSNRSQSVLINDSFSSKVPLLRGVPQGSVLGPLLFSMYVTPLSQLLLKSSVMFHFYADDTQLYVSFSSSDSDLALDNLSKTLDKVYSWFCCNRLAVNPSKTEYLLVGITAQRMKITDQSVLSQGLALTPSESARNLGVVFDTQLKFKDHISSVCCSSYFFIRQLRQIRSSIDKNSAIILANSIIHSKIDYCNSLFFGLSSASIKRLQRVQNSLARVVCKTNKWSSTSSSLLKELHWLPVSQRIVFKIAVLTFKTFRLGEPSYLSSLLRPYIPRRSLRSSDANLLIIPDIRSEVGRRSFSFSAPTIWNSLPKDLRDTLSLSSFRAGLKTHLYPP